MKTNSQLILGIIVIIIGLVLLIYSVSSYFELRVLADKIDFEELDNNNRIPTQERYYKYLSIADYLNQSLNKNKNLPIKNASCAYVDYAQHNTISLYNLIYKGGGEDLSKRNVVEGNIKHLSEMLGNYKMCARVPEYKKELDNLLEEIYRADELQKNNRTTIEEFLNNSDENSDLNTDLNINELNSQEENSQGYIEKRTDSTIDNITDNAPLIEKINDN